MEGDLPGTAVMDNHANGSQMEGSTTFGSTAAVGRDSLESPYYGVTRIRVRTPIRVTPLGSRPSLTLAGAEENHLQVRRSRQKPLSTQPKAFWAIHFLI